MKYIKFYLILFICVLCFNCAEKKKFDFWKYNENEELKKALLNESGIGSDISSIDEFINKNFSFYQNAKIIRTSENDFNYITIVIIKEDFLKIFFCNKEYFFSIVIIYKFNNKNKLLDITVE